MLKKHYILPLFSLALISLQACSESASTEEKSTDTVSTSPFPNLLIGTYTRIEGHVEGKADGIYVAHFDEKNGVLRVQDTVSSLPNPSYLEVDYTQNRLYVANETGSQPGEETGTVTFYHMNPEGDWILEQEISSEGKYPCHVSSSDQARWLGVANYGGGISIYKQGEEGQLTLSSQHSFPGHGTHPRQEASHPHMIHWVKDTDMFMVPDLGLDKIWVFGTVDSAVSHVLLDTLHIPSSAGPRHLASHPNKPLFYVLNELNGSVLSFQVDENGNFDNIGTTGSIGAEPNTEAHSSAIKVHLGGKFAYAANRGDVNTIALLEIDPETGAASFKEMFSTEGKTPRDFSISPNGRWLIAGNQDSGTVIVFAIDEKAGTLTKHSIQDIPTPVCFEAF